MGFTEMIRCKKTVKTNGIYVIDSMKRFQYCTVCGKRLSWTAIKKEFIKQLKDSK